MFTRLLYRIFRRQFLKYYHSEQTKGNGFEKMEKVFVDSSGRVYYRYSRDLDMPINRFKEVQKMLMLIKAGISEDSIKLFISSMKDSINGGKKPDIAKIGFFITELESRLGVFVDPDTLFSCAALMYIREDESLIEVDSVVHKEKIEQFKIDSQGGLYDFFYSAGLTDYIPFVGTTENEFNEYLRESELKLKALTMYMERYSTERPLLKV